jgi:hypothetical protein
MLDAEVELDVDADACCSWRRWRSGTLIRGWLAGRVRSTTQEEESFHARGRVMTMRAVENLVSVGRHREDANTAEGVDGTSLSNETAVRCFQRTTAATRSS